MDKRIERAGIFAQGAAFALKAGSVQIQNAVRGVKTATPHPRDPTVLSSESIYDAILFKNRNVKIMHIKQQLPDVFNRVAEIGFDDVCHSMTLALRNNPNASDYWPKNSAEIGEEILHHLVEQKRKTQIVLAGLFGSASNVYGFEHYKSSRHDKGEYGYHIDRTAYAAVQSLYGDGVEYVAMPPGFTKEEFRQVEKTNKIDETRMEAVIAEAGDLVLTKGHANGRREEMGCGLHRSAHCDERLVSVYPIGWN